MNALTQYILDGLSMRWDAPLAARLMLQPLVSGVIGYRSGRRDARKGEAPFLSPDNWSGPRHKRLSAERRRDVGILFCVAVVCDLIYQAVVEATFSVLAAAVVGVVLAFIPYIMARTLAGAVWRRSQAQAKDRS